MIFGRKKAGRDKSPAPSKKDAEVPLDHLDKVVGGVQSSHKSNESEDPEIVSVANAAARQIAEFSASYVDGLSTADFRTLGSRISNLNDSALASVDATQLAGASLASLSDRQLALLTPEQIEGVTASQITSLSPNQVAALGVDISGLSESAVGRLSATQVDAMTVSQIAALDTQLASLSASALQSIDPVQFAGVSSRALAALDLSHFRALMGDDSSRVQLLSAGQVDGLSLAQIGVLGSRMASLSDAALGSLDASQVAAAPLDALSTHQLERLSAEQLSRVSAAQVGRLEGDEVRALGLSVAGLSTSARTGLDRDALTSAQLAVLGWSQPVVTISTPRVSNNESGDRAPSPSHTENAETHADDDGNDGEDARREGDGDDHDDDHDDDRDEDRDDEGEEESNEDESQDRQGRQAQGLGREVDDHDEDDEDDEDRGEGDDDALLSEEIQVHPSAQVPETLDDSRDSPERIVPRRDTTQPTSDESRDREVTLWVPEVELPEGEPEPEIVLVEAQVEGAPEPNIAVVAPQPEGEPEQTVVLAEPLPEPIPERQEPQPALISLMPPEVQLTVEGLGEPAPPEVTVEVAELELPEGEPEPEIVLVEAQVEGEPEPNIAVVAPQPEGEPEQTVVLAEPLPELIAPVVPQIVLTLAELGEPAPSRPEGEDSAPQDDLSEVDSLPSSPPMDKELARAYFEQLDQVHYEVERPPLEGIGPEVRVVHTHAPEREQEESDEASDRDADSEDSDDHVADSESEPVPEPVQIASPQQQDPSPVLAQPLAPVVEAAAAAPESSQAPSATTASAVSSDGEPVAAAAQEIEPGATPVPVHVAFSPDQPSPAQLSTWTDVQVAGLGLNLIHLPPASLAVLRPEQISALTPVQWVALGARAVGLAPSDAAAWDPLVFQTVKGAYDQASARAGASGGSDSPAHASQASVSSAAEAAVGMWFIPLPEVLKESTEFIPPDTYRAVSPGQLLYQLVQQGVNEAGPDGFLQQYLASEAGGVLASRQVQGKLDLMHGVSDLFSRTETGPVHMASLVEDAANASCRAVLPASDAFGGAPAFEGVILLGLDSAGQIDLLSFIDDDPASSPVSYPVG